MVAKNFKHDKIIRISEWNESGIFKVRVPAKNSKRYEIISVRGSRDEYENIKSLKR